MEMLKRMIEAPKKWEMGRIVEWIGLMLKDRILLRASELFV